MNNCKITQSRQRRFRRVSLLFPVFWLALPPTVFAPTRGGEAIGLTSGLRRPFSRWDYIFGTIAAGIWGAQLGAPAIWLLPVIFVIMMVLGGMLGFVGVRLPRVQPGIALSVIVFAVAILSEAEPELWIAAAIVGLFAIFHGYAHGTELPPGGDGLFFSLGFALTTVGLLAIGIGIGVIDPWSSLQLVLDAGIVIALAGVAFFWQAIRPSDRSTKRGASW
jgi:urease accessory protein